MFTLSGNEVPLLGEKLFGGVCGPRFNPTRRRNSLLFVFDLTDFNDIGTGVVTRSVDCLDANVGVM